MTRDEARSAFADSGLTYSVLSKPSLESLRQLIDAEMKNAKLIDGSLRMRNVCSVRDTKLGTEAYLRCKAHYFSNREAITFNRNGFIGLAGWADDENVQPFLAGFIAWIAIQARASQQHENQQ